MNLAQFGPEAQEKAEKMLREYKRNRLRLRRIEKSIESRKHALAGFIHTAKER